MAFIDMPNLKLAFPPQVTGIVAKVLSARLSGATAPVQPVPVRVADPRWIASERREHEVLGALRDALYADAA